MVLMRVTTALLALAVVAHRANGQGSDSTKTAHPSSSVVLFDIVLANDRPGAPDPNDSAKAVLATQKLRESLSNATGGLLIESASVAAAESRLVHKSLAEKWARSGQSPERSVNRPTSTGHSPDDS